jgi:RNA polymerase sigma factor for flagellar operon FliA
MFPLCFSCFFLFRQAGNNQLQQNGSMASTTTYNTVQSTATKLSPKLREEAIVKYAYLVKYIAGRMAMRVPPSVSFDELVSAGTMGLIHAVDRFDPEKQTDIKTFAEYRIRGAILDELRSMDWYSRSMRKRIQDVEAAIRNIETRKGAPAEDHEVAAELNLPLEDYHSLLSNIHSVSLLNLDDFIRSEENETVGRRSFQDKIVSDDDPVENVSKIELKRVLAQAIRNLSEKEQMVISLYYYDDLTLKEIGQVMNLTESRICQIHTQTLIKLKTRLKRYYEA